MNHTFLKDMGHGLIHLLYPRLCEGCGKQLVGQEQVLCLSCAMHIPETAYHDIADNETAIRFAGRIPFLYATSYAYFTNDGLLQHLLHGLKYKGKKETGNYLGRKFAFSLKDTPWINTIDMIVPVPMHPAKQAKRGYNQSMLIAEGIAGVLDLPTSDKCLLKVKETDSQTHKTRIERTENMRETFKLHLKHSLKGKHILLCDDVLTSGATMEACALALQAEESIKISIATIGIAVS